MDNHSFKIGDKVKVICIDTSLPWANGQALIGQIGIVSKVGYGLFPIVVEFGAKTLENLLGDAYNGNVCYSFGKSELDYTIRIGQQLEFAFMY